MKKKICLPLSVLNEAEALDKFLKYHSWADEIIVFDSGSTDRTEEVCKRYACRIVKCSLNGNYNQRAAFILTQTKADWILFIAPDEFVTPELKSEIDKVLENDNEPYQAYENRRINYFMDKPLMHGGWSGYDLKFMKREAASFIGDSYHEKPIINGKVGRLEGTLLHYPNPNIHWVLQKFNFISEFDSKEYYNNFGELSEKKFKRLLLTKPLKNFWKGYIKKKGYKDGLHGFIYAVLIWAFDVIRICKYGEKYIIKNPNMLSIDKLPDPWDCRK